MQLRLLVPLLTLGGLAASCQSGPTPERQGNQAPQAWREIVPDFRRYAARSKQAATASGVHLERITAAVPWPRGLAWKDNKLVVLARGRHRRSGGIDPQIKDQAGTLFTVDPRIAEPYQRGTTAGEATLANASVLSAPAGQPFQLYDAAAGKPIEQYNIDRPYCTLAFDEESDNFFICGYSGVDLPKGRFRKNATDSILRYDLRTKEWLIVEAHNPAGMAREDFTSVVPSRFFPHHDPDTNAAPHGWLNGPNGAKIVGDYLYAVGKDNHVLAQYNLTNIRLDPQAPPPQSRIIFGDRVRIKLDGEIQEIPVYGHSATAQHNNFLYVGFRTSSIILRFPLQPNGDLVWPLVGELVAVFEPWSTETGRSANLIDLTFNASGELFVACAQEGRVWNIGKPDPARVFDGVDVGDNPTWNQPFLDLQAMTDNPKARCGNILFDDHDRLYVCSGNYESGTRLAGVIYRATTR